jgi:RNA polymerase sigma factor (sigma-70 family)
VSAAAESLALALAPDVRAAASGDQQAFTRLVESTHGAVCAIAMAIVRNREASEDVAQEVYLRAWTRLGELRNPASFLPWLRQLTRRHALDIARRRTRDRNRHVAGEADVLASVADERADPRERLLSEEESALLAEALSALPDDAREVVILYHREGRSTRHVAELLDLTEDAVRQRLSRARKQLRAEVMERLGEGLRATAPTAGFVAAVAASLSLAGPAAAGTAALVAGSGAVLSGSKAGKLALLFGGAGAGILAGLGGVLIGTRLEMRCAGDEAERAAVRRIGLINGAAVVVTGAALVLLSMYRPEPMGFIAVYVALVATLGITCLVGLPRAQARRLARERAEDPRAASRQRRQMLVRIGGWLAGAAGGAAGLYAGLGML